MSYQQKSLFATLPRTERGKPVVLGGDPKGKNFLYTNGNSVIIRNIDNPAIADVYTEHSQPATVAKYSPSGFYIASGDQGGKVRIWDTVNKEHVLKCEYQPLGGVIKDLAWSADSKWIVVGGEGRDKFGSVFNMDMGSSVGEIMGQSKALNSVDFSPVRPFKVVTASEDNTVAYFDDRPIKFKFTLNDHQRFVNTVRFSPDGLTFASGGADGKVFVYDGKTGEKRGELGSPAAHGGGVYGLSYSADGKRVLTASGDKTAKVWDLENLSLVTEFVLGSGVEDQQLGCLWQDSYLLSVSLSGFINYLDLDNPSKPFRIVKGHNKPVTGMTLDDSRTTIFTASSDGGVCHWNAQTGENDMFGGKGHSNQVQNLTTQGDTLISIGMDDMIMFSSITNKTYGEKVKLPSLPRGLAAASDGLIVVACINDLVLLKDHKLVNSQKVDWEPNCVDIATNLAELAVGGAKDQKLHIFSLQGNSLSPTKVLDHGGAVTDVKYSPDGGYLAACDTYRKIILYSLPNYEALVTGEWGMHTARVNSLAWTPDSQRLGSGALDTNVIVWSPQERMKQVTIKNAHPMNQVTRVAWLDGTTLVSAGQDSSVRQWTIKW